MEIRWGEGKGKPLLKAKGLKEESERADNQTGSTQKKVHMIFIPATSMGLYHQPSALQLHIFCHSRNTKWGGQTAFKHAVGRKQGPKFEWLPDVCYGEGPVRWDKYDRSSPCVLCGSGLSLETVLLKAWMMGVFWLKERGCMSPNPIC